MFGNLSCFRTGKVRIHRLSLVPAGQAPGRRADYPLYAQRRTMAHNACARSRHKRNLEFMEPATAERPPDLQETIRLEFGNDVPSEVWEALEAVRPFLNHPPTPQFQISMIGTGCVFAR
jgi:hypothetical protein